MGMLSKLVGKAVAKKAGKESSKDVAKKSTEVMARKSEKYMGMADEVSPKRLSGPKAEEATKRGGVSGKAIAAGAAATGAVGATMLSRKDKEEKASPTRVESKGRSFQDERPTRDAGRVSSKSEETKSDKKPSTFGSAFKEARAAGKDVFTFNGKKYTTEMAGEKKPTPKVQAAPRAIAAEDDATKRLSKGVREGRNTNIDDDTRKRAMASVANLAKGGAVKAKKK